MKAINIGLGTGSDDFTRAIDAKLNVAIRHLKHDFTAYEIRSRARDAERRLECFGINKMDRVGARIVITSSAPVERRYKYCRKGQTATLIRRSSGWFLVDVQDVELWPNQGGETTLFLTATQDTIAVTNFKSQYSVIV